MNAMTVVRTTLIRMAATKTVNIVMKRDHFSFVTISLLLLLLSVKDVGFLLVVVVALLVLLYTLIALKVVKIFDCGRR